MKLNKIITIEGQIKIMTGLHIGAGNTEMHIGGLDNPVIKHPYTFEPYIPGSSLKGKVRSLLELHSGIKLINGKPLSTKIINDDLNKDKDKTFAENIIKLFLENKYKNIFKTKTGSYSTSEDILKILMPYNPQIISLILSYREYSKLLSFIDNLISEVKNERIYTHFDQVST
ncbi:MAG: type III-A CRISPR-associated RAMP protein Csm3, partial [Acidobacteria bacterium]|nr:type III-A CRISPR-associated RAMP protein Csm3 [Acidobacteriota bacterium]